MDRLAIAAALREMSGLLDLAGESRYRSRAYARAARSLEQFGGDFPALVRDGRLTELPGIGDALAAVVREMHESGRSAALERLRQGLPPGALELAQVPGLTVERMRRLHAELGVTTLRELEQAAREGRVRAVAGFGEKTEEKLLAAVAELATRRERMLLHHGWDVADRLLEHLRGAPGLVRAEAAGSLRRWAETVGDVNLVAAAPRETRPGVLDRFTSYPAALTTLERDERRAAITLVGGARATLDAVTPARWAGTLVCRTGARGHVKQLARAARAAGLVLGKRGGLRGRRGSRVATASEEEFYARLGLPWIAPELREGAGEVEAAAAGELPPDLVAIDDLRGMTHCHSTWSDGGDSIEAMCRAAEAMGMRYITITDHSPAAHYANGLDLARLERQWEEIERVQEQVSIRILRGSEVDILADGALDWPDAVLERMDVVIASIHARHKQDEEAMTRRLVRAMRHPCFKIWGHGLGRYVLRRPPVPCRVEEVLDALAESRGAIEVNGNPHRLDLEPRWLREARRRGIRFVISTDAHSTGELHNLRYGVHTARRGWLGRGEVLNALPAEEFARAVRPA